MILRDSPRTVPAPVPAWNEGAPRIQGPAIYGASPGKDFLMLIPTTGERPIRYSASGLPAGLSLDGTDGRIVGRAARSGRYAVRLQAENGQGVAVRDVEIVIGSRALALTPPLGWNSWNCFRGDIDAAKIERIGEGMVSSGLAAFGYVYVNLDSGWQSARRGGRFRSIVPHDGFPDMAALCERLHGMGLKAGIYSGPYVMPWGTEGCGTTSGPMDTRFPSVPRFRGKYVGLHKHEVEDAAQWADWGFDYVKYDWANTDVELAGRMSRALRRTARDMVYSVTTSVRMEDAAEISRLCHLWRSNADTHPAWESVVKNGFGNEAWNPHIGPGHWFDLDMTALLPRDGTCLTENERVLCLSCWALRPSPILIDSVPGDMDAFTRHLLCNEDVLAVNQDALGLPAAVIERRDGWEVQIKPLADGSCAVGFFNLNDQAGESPELDFAKHGQAGEVRLRDLWARRDVEARCSKLAVAVEGHGAKLFRAWSD